MKADPGGTDSIEKGVRSILDSVRAGGDQAVRTLTAKFDGVDLGLASLKVSPEEIDAAIHGLSPDFLAAAKASIQSVQQFHRKTRPKNWTAENPDRAMVGERFYPLRRVGLYIPGGNVPLVSTAIMTAVPGVEAGVPQLAACTPPNPYGEISRELLAVLGLCGVREIYKIGGAQAIAAMAFGTETVPGVDKVFGPGNAYVMEAKRQVYGTVGVDLLPGPSEVMVIADQGARPEWVAADLLAQAEHGSGKEKIYAAVPNHSFAEQVQTAMERQVSGLSHQQAISSVLREGFFGVICPDWENAAQLANEVAPEHLELQVAPEAVEGFLEKIHSAGAFLIGYHTPTALGDFVAGPSHTLPTGGAARFSSGLQLIDFMRRSSVVRYDAESLSRAAPSIDAFATMERLDAHGKSVRIRLKRKTSQQSV